MQEASFPCSLVWTWLAIHLPAAEHSGAEAVSFVSALGITQGFGE